MKKVLKIAGLLIGGVFALWCAAVVSLFVLLTWPTNDRDNADPAMRREMIRLVRAWGRLAPFAASARALAIRAEGSTFTRSFRGSFSDTPTPIKSWPDASPGVIEGTAEPAAQGTKYILDSARGANHGEVTMSANGAQVSFYVSSN